MKRPRLCTVCSRKRSTQGMPYMKAEITQSYVGKAYTDVSVTPNVSVPVRPEICVYTCPICGTTETVTNNYDECGNIVNSGIGYKMAAVTNDDLNAS